MPVAKGCEAPLVGAATHAGDIHGRTGLDGAELPVPDRGPIATHAVDFIIEQAERHKGELVLAVVGPQTNVALALRREPRLASWLKAITIMGGSTTIGNITPAAEFNIYADPEAAAAVFACGAPIWMVGYNVTRQTGFTQPEIDRLRAGGGVLFSHVTGGALPPTASAQRPGLAGRPFEAMGVSLVLHPRNPFIPTVHLNVRFFIAYPAAGSTDAPVDLQPCGGTHVRHTGEIGRVEVTKIENKGRQNRRVSLVLVED